MSWALRRTMHGMSWSIIKKNVKVAAIKGVYFTSHSPAAPSLVVSLIHLSATSVTATSGTSCPDRRVIRAWLTAISTCSGHNNGTKKG